MNNYYYKCRNYSFPSKLLPGTPRYLIPYIPKNKDAYILEIGCGEGKFIADCVVTHKRKNVIGIDISEESVSFCKKYNLPVFQEDVFSFLNDTEIKFDFIYMSHVLEHFSKDKTIPLLHLIHKKLSTNGKLFIVVPNAQSSVDSYWMYEDFTHDTLFTTGSLYYVLCEAGFDKIEFVDLDGFGKQKGWKIKMRKFFLKLYKQFKKFERWITNSYYHNPSPISYAWEIKVIATK